MLVFTLKSLALIPEVINLTINENVEKILLKPKITSHSMALKSGYNICACKQETPKECYANVFKYSCCRISIEIFLFT